jgi:hypothetical protein
MKPFVVLRAVGSVFSVFSSFCLPFSVSSTLRNILLDCFNCNLIFPTYKNLLQLNNLQKTFRTAYVTGSCFDKHFFVDTTSDVIDFESANLPNIMFQSTFPLKSPGDLH